MGTTIRVWLDGRELDVPAHRRLTVGSSDRADLRAEHPAVSPMHALLSADDDGWTLTDLDSAGGLFVDGRLVHSLRITTLTDVRLGDAVTGARVQLLPEDRASANDGAGAKPQTADGAATEGAVTPPDAFLRGPVRVGLATVIVLVAAYATTKLLEGLGTPELLEKVGFSWLAAVPRVDKALARLRLPWRSGRLVTREAEDAGPPPYRTVLYAGMVLAAVIQLGAFLGGLLLSLMVSDQQAVVGLASMVTLVVGSVALFLIGRWLGRNDPAGAVPALYASTLMGIGVAHVIDLLLLDQQQYLELMGTPRRLSTVLGGAVIWCLVAATLGQLGIRSGRRGQNPLVAEEPAISPRPA